ncbi:hypothetical protein RRG08_049401 [Elysia crispata]|uniref:Uncharacterized protein n=1 Tax=Elysia crispata TaxID=231223 RepID=A0AAE1CEX1_9GAST|nr:hypothetical protein RRG08_049401 [Elysia crispata]
MTRIPQHDVGKSLTSSRLTSNSTCAEYLNTSASLTDETKSSSSRHTGRPGHLTIFECIGTDSEYRWSGWMNACPQCCGDQSLGKLGLTWLLTSLVRLLCSVKQAGSNVAIDLPGTTTPLREASWDLSKLGSKVAIDLPGTTSRLREASWGLRWLLTSQVRLLRSAKQAGLLAS